MILDVLGEIKDEKWVIWKIFWWFDDEDEDDYQKWY